MTITAGSGQTAGLPLVITAVTAATAQTVHTAPVGTATPHIVRVFAINVDGNTYPDIGAPVTVRVLSSGGTVIATRRVTVKDADRMLDVFGADLVLNGTDTIDAYGETTSTVAICVRVDDQANGMPFNYVSTAASAAVTNTVVVTAFDKIATMPASLLRVGDRIQIRAQAIATATNSTDTLTLKALLGTTELASTGAVDVANNDIGIIDIELTVRTIGATGTFVLQGAVALGASGTVTGAFVYKASTAADTTVALPVSITAGWSVANAGNSVRLDILSVQVIR